MVFKSKIDLWFMALVTVLPGYMIYDAYSFYLKNMPNQALSALGGCLITLFVLLGLMGTTKYVIDDDELLVSFLGLKSKIKLRDIMRVEKTKTLASAPALSLDRIRIIGKEGSFSVISPMERQEFLDLLKERNPNIDFLL